jgi:Arc/MetJ family transcription regulator
MPLNNRPKEPMLARQAIDDALRAEVARAFEAACVDGNREDFRKAISAAIEMHQWAIDVFVLGKA